MRYSVQGLVVRDIEEILGIEPRRKDQWFENDFRIVINTGGIECYVYRVDGVVIGYIVFELHEIDIRIVSLVIGVEWRRQGYGSDLFDVCRLFLNKQRDSVYVHVRERDLTAQLFFSHCGFQWIGTVDDFHEDTDSYLMMYRGAA